MSTVIRQHVIKSRTLGIGDETVWIWVDHIASITANKANGLAVVFTDDGKTIYLNEKAEAVMETIVKVVNDT